MKNKRFFVTALIACTMLMQTAYAEDVMLSKQEIGKNAQESQEIEMQISKFTDMPSDIQEYIALRNAVENGILSGKSDSVIDSYSPITRAEMGTILARCFGAVRTADISGFSDVNKSDWYYDYMSKAVAMGAFYGSDDNTLSPNANITIQETFAVVSRIFGIKDFDLSDLDKFADRSDIAAWAEESVAKIISNGYWEDDDTLKPLSNMTRVKFAELMQNIVTAYIDKPGIYSDLPDGNIVVRSGHVSITDTENTQYIILGDGLADDWADFNNCTLNNVIARNNLISFKNSKLNYFYTISSDSVTYMSDMIDVKNTYVKGTKDENGKNSKLFMRSMPVNIISE